MNILVIAAHPDDEVLGCGGTIAKLSEQGHVVNIVILGEGITSRKPRRDQTDPKLVKALHHRLEEAASLLGAEEAFMSNMPDNRFDAVPLLDIVKIIEDFISKLKPDIVYTHGAGDLNIDHTIVHRAVLTATRPVPGQQVREIYSFEVPSSTEWSFQRLGSSFTPNVFIDISETLGVKLKALALYDSELRAFPHPRSHEAVQAIASRWGSVIGCKAAEAFELVRAIR